MTLLKEWRIFAICLILALSLACSLPAPLQRLVDRTQEQVDLPAEEEDSRPPTPARDSSPAPLQPPPPGMTARPNTPLEGVSLNPNPPAKTVRLVFIHHSTGEGWLNDDGGRLGIALRDNRYYVSDTNYDWGPLDATLDGPIGSFTDIGHWWNWFLGPNRDRVTAALFAEKRQASEYSRRNDDPGGANEIILFKSCFPNSALNGKPGDAPARGGNPLRGMDSGHEAMTIANAKGIYLDLLNYFASRPDKLFVVITQPPLSRASTSAAEATNARAFSTWLATDWLKEYPYANVAVFDFFTVLTSNAGRSTANDLNSDKGNHHRWRAGKIEYITNQGSNFSAYSSSNDDSHPTPAGGQKATAEFLPLLNIYYHRWKGD